MTAKTEYAILAGGYFWACSSWCGGSRALCRPVSVTYATTWDTTYRNHGTQSKSSSAPRR